MQERSSYSGTWPGANTHPSACQTSQFPKNPTPHPTKSSGFPVPAGARAGGSPGGEAGEAGTGHWETRNRFQPAPKAGAQTPSPSAGQGWRHLPRLGRAKPRARSTVPCPAVGGVRAPAAGRGLRRGRGRERRCQLLVKPINSFGTALAIQ